MVTWGKKLYETGIEKVVLFPCDDTGAYGDGVAWDGVTTVSEKPSGAEVTAIYADNDKYLNIMSREDFACSIEAYTYPDEWAACDGSAELSDGLEGAMVYAQARRRFGLVYNSLLGSEAKGIDEGYKMHFVYGCMAAPSERSYQTVNENIEGMTFSWEISTLPVEIPGKKKSALITLDSTKLGDAKMKAVCDYVYGTASTEGKFPTPEKLIELLGGSAA